MSRPVPRAMLMWGLRLMLGVALGWGYRLVYERRPAVRFAAGMAVRTMRGSEEAGASRGSHLRHGEPHFFSLDQIMAADDPAAALRGWREAFVRMPEDGQRAALEARAEVSATSLRQLLFTLPASAPLREELGQLMNLATSLGADLYDPEATQKSLAQLAQIDPGLALDGAAALGSEAALGSIWEVMAEDDPERVLALAQSGQAPPEAMEMAVAGLAARDIEKADALLSSLPVAAQERAAEIFADILARTRPLEAMTLVQGDDGLPDRGMAALLIERVPGPQAVDFLLGLERQHPELLESCSQEVTALLGAQAKRDPGFVLEWLERRTAQTPGASHIGRPALQAVAAFDPERTAAWVERLGPNDPASKDLPSLRQAVVSAWASRDPITALEWASRQPNPSEWLGELNWAESIPPSQAAAVADWIRENPTVEGSGSVVRAWMRVDPPSAVDWATQLPPGPLRQSAVGSAANFLSHSRLPEQRMLMKSLIQAAPEALGIIVNAVHPDQFPMPREVVKALPQLMAQASIYGTSHVAGHLAHGLRSPATRDATLDAVTRLPDIRQRQELLEQMAADSHGRNEVPLAVHRRLASLMPDPEAARRFIEMETARRFYP